jgi:hypothetical protein
MLVVVAEVLTLSTRQELVEQAGADQEAQTM